MAKIEPRFVAPMLQQAQRLQQAIQAAEISAHYAAELAKNISQAEAAQLLRDTLEDAHLSVHALIEYLEQAEDEVREYLKHS